MEVNTSPLELYIHIPFCTSKCAYCDFVSFPVGLAASSIEGGIMEDYTDALVSEIKARGGVYGNRPISSIYIGGGTPSVLSGRQMEKIIRALFESFNIKRKISRESSAKIGSSFRYAVGLLPKITKIREKYEFSIEVNPGTAGREKLKMYREMGINRLSIGLQSPDDRDLLVLGRTHTFSRFKETFSWAREAGFKNISIDLMQSIPGQTPERWRTALRDTLEFKPEHISVYSLTIEKDTPFGKSRTEDEKGNVYVKSAGGTMVKLPDDEEDRRIYRETKEILGTAGYRRYEISNYAKKGRECAHNIGYWRRRDYLGLGLHSSSMIDNVRWKNTSDLHEYIDGCRFFAAGEDAVRRNTYKVSPADQMTEFMFLGLRMADGISKAEFNENFGTDFDEIFGAKVKELMDLDLIVLNTGEYKSPVTGITGSDVRVALTDRGVDVANAVEAYFLPE